jgi:hypothetical protein
MDKAYRAIAMPRLTHEPISPHTGKVDNRDFVQKNLWHFLEKLA